VAASTQRTFTPLPILHSMTRLYSPSDPPSERPSQTVSKPTTKYWLTRQPEARHPQPPKNKTTEGLCVPVNTASSPRIELRWDDLPLAQIPTVERTFTQSQTEFHGAEYVDEETIAAHPPLAYPPQCSDATRKLTVFWVRVSGKVGKIE
jgi:hypothetical protein